MSLIYLFSDTDIDWVDLADDIRHEYYVVDNLRPSHGYKFRVLARNTFGWSIPSIPSGIVMTPSSGASKAEFYDALQGLQVSTIGLNAKKTAKNRFKNSVKLTDHSNACFSLTNFPYETCASLWCACNNRKWKLCQFAETCLVK